VSTRDVELCGGGGGYVKNCGRIAVGFASSETSAAEIPLKPKFRLNKKFLFFTASALIFCAALDFSQSAKAEATLTVASIKAALGGELQAASPRPSAQSSRQYSNDDAVSALSNFAQQIRLVDSSPVSAAPVNADRMVGDEAFAALQDFAQRVGMASQPVRMAAAASETEPANDGLGATFVGSQKCMTCHATHAAEFGKTLMGKIGKTQKGKFECENCHGAGSVHVRKGGGRGVGGIISFRDDDHSRTAEENNAICLACHQRGNRTLWAGSPHEQHDVACTNCHTIMKNVSRKSQLKTEFQPDTCFQCHKNKRGEMWRSSHIPVREGKVTCTSCHNPHGSPNESLLKTATVNEACYQCHAEKRGPFLWEHPPVRDDCLNCHNPHGSNNDFLLKISRPRLCQQCHAGGQHNSNARGPNNTLYAQGRECQNCHSNHHGSNSPSGARFMR
jgi:DmsE family decaheme c-type cytochrome